MSFLSIAFAAAAGAVVFPIVFHLIRQTPKHRQEFSSLMFLEPSPPRLTRRSRLDDILLLSLRTLAICLLAFAFMRPFLPGNDSLALDDVRGRRLLILVDASASMRRDGLWQKAQEEVAKVLDDVEPVDQLAFASFSDRLRVHVPFSDSSESGEQIDAVQQRELIRDAMQKLEPTWAQTNLGTALIRSRDLFEDADESEAETASQVVLISDVQEGAESDSLQSVEWPTDVKVDVRPIVGKRVSNASLRTVLPTPGEPVPESPRVRVGSTPDSSNEEFVVRWATSASEAQQAVTFVVPAGESRVLDVPLDESARTYDRLVLTGDGTAFDNQFFVAPSEPLAIPIAFYGSEQEDDAEGLLYYFARALVDTPARAVTVRSIQKPDDLNANSTSAFSVVARPLSSEEQTAIDSSLEAGSDVLVVLQSHEMASGLAELIGTFTKADEGEADQSAADRLLAEIDFQHPLFEPFASPRFNDFTDVRFWKTISGSLDGEDSIRVLARFDDRTPALWQRRRSNGTVFVLTAGWRPEESQLALSNKFVPLLEGLLKQSLPTPLADSGYVVGDAVPIERPAGNETVVVTDPNGTETVLDASDSSFVATGTPGLYTLKIGDRKTRFAANLAPEESRTTPFETDVLANLGVAVGVHSSQSEEFDRQRALRDQELEQRQKIWKWLIVAALFVLCCEMGLAGYRQRQNQQIPGQSARATGASV